MNGKKTERQGEAYAGREKDGYRDRERLKEGERYREKRETETGREIKTVRGKNRDGTGSDRKTERQRQGVT